MWAYLCGRVSISGGVIIDVGKVIGAPLLPKQFCQGQDVIRGSAEGKGGGVIEDK